MHVLGRAAKKEGPSLFFRGRMERKDGKEGHWCLFSRRCVRQREGWGGGAEGGRMAATRCVFYFDRALHSVLKQREGGRMEKGRESKRRGVKRVEVGQGRKPNTPRKKKPNKGRCWFFLWDKKERRQA